ncbi:zf-DHHC-domain-containing protein [Sparassis latifolia]|uniref:Palmitoyltransferase PFA4 n=1 Tax=Sparassis crispa TaxID=139825 RepID=A0A401G5W9_9APHY|nr:Palmitoyltransferase PFA4 [Sparassis crispa]GBE77566.1 Palmitoyltransferase PFA4 [Sparassis crispa]
MGRLIGRLFVGFTLCLICFIAYSAQIFIIWPWYGHELSIELLVLLVPFNLLVGMLLWNYYLCVVTDPGRVPPAWQPDLQDGDGYEVKKNTRGPRYCRTCESYKPPRAHHCKQCKRCILRMDHHCPWVNNCIGHFNYGHFLRFLFYVDIACSYHAAMVTRRVYVASVGNYFDYLSGTELIFIILNYVTCLPVLLAVGGFSLYHLYSLLGNSTTIEGWEKDKAATLVRHGKIREIKFPYNLGMRLNVESVLGANPLLWCWPTVTPGTGLKYQLAYGDDSTAEAWPPQDPNRTYTYPEPDQNHKFSLPSTPWTYENGTLNPNLQPSNPRLRSSSTRRRKPKGPGYSSLPPYHPDFHEAQDDDAYSASASSAGGESDGEQEQGLGEDPHHMYGSFSGVRVRRGSEGYEVQSADRDKIMRRFLECQTREPGRYQRYVPEPPSESETDEEATLSHKEE